MGTAEFFFSFHFPFFLPYPSLSVQLYFYPLIFQAGCHWSAVASQLEGSGHFVPADYPHFDLARTYIL